MAIADPTEVTRLRDVLTTLLRDADQLRDCALALDDRATAARLAQQIARIQRRLVALPSEGTPAPIINHPN